MAELATIARPYAEALFKALGNDAAAAAWVEELGAIAADEGLLQFAGNPKVTPDKVFDLVKGLVKTSLPQAGQNFVKTVIENGRLQAVPEIAVQFRALVNAKGGSSDAEVFSAYPIEGAALNDLKALLEKRFGRKLNVTVKLDAELIGGIRVVVGDEVLDTSVKARLEQMKAALTA